MNMDLHDWPYPPSVRPAARTRSPPRYFVLLDDKLYPPTSTAPANSCQDEGRYQIPEIREEYRPHLPPPRRTNRVMQQTIIAPPAAAPSGIHTPRAPVSSSVCPPQEPAPPRPATVPSANKVSALPLSRSENTVAGLEGNATGTLTKKGPPLPDQKEAYAAFRTHAQRVGQNTSRPRRKSKPWYRPKNRNLCHINSKAKPKDDRPIDQHAIRGPSSNPGLKIKGAGRVIVDLTSSDEENSRSNNVITANPTFQSRQNTASSATAKQETPRPPLGSLGPSHQPPLPAATISSDPDGRRDIPANPPMSQAELKMRLRGWERSIAVTASIPPSQPKPMSTSPPVRLPECKEVQVGFTPDEGKNAAFRPGRLNLKPGNKPDHLHPKLNFPTTESPHCERKTTKAAAVDVDINADTNMDMAMDIDTDIVDSAPSSNLCVGVGANAHTYTEPTFGIGRGCARGPIFGLPSTLGRPSYTGGSFSLLAGRAGDGSRGAATSSSMGGVAGVKRQFSQIA